MFAVYTEQRKRSSSLTWVYSSFAFSSFLSEGDVWRARVVLLHPEGPEVPERGEAEQGGDVRVLEGHGDR